jgi:mannonate dehydratase
MLGVIQALMNEERRRYLQGGQMDEIPMRPDHGHLLLEECDEAQSPGYSLIGRLKGLAELRGVMEGLKNANRHLQLVLQ